MKLWVYTQALYTFIIHVVSTEMFSVPSFYQNKT